MTVTSAADVRLIRRKLGRARQRYLVAHLLSGSAEAVLWALGLAALSLGADYAFELQPLGRLLLLVVYGTLLVVALVCRVVGPVLRSPGDDELALRVEARYPGLSSALISTVQLSRRDPRTLGAMSPGLIRALGAYAAELTRPLRFASVMPLGSSLRLATVALLVAVATWSFVQSHDALIAAWAERMFHPLSSTARYPTRTRIEVVTGSPVVPRGEDEEIVAVALGEVPPTGLLHYRATRGEWQKTDLLPVAGRPGWFSVVLEKLLENTEYYVELGDARSESYELRVVARPRVTQLRARYELPTYAGGGTRESPTGDVEVLTGTWVELTATTNKPVNEARLELDGTVIPVDIGADGTLRTRFQVSADGTYRIRLRDRYGLENRDPIVHLVRALADRPPRVVIRSPARNKDMTPIAYLPIQFELTDDFGITEAQLCYAVQKPLLTDVAPELAEPEAPAGAREAGAETPAEPYVTDLSEPTREAAGPPKLTYAAAPLPGPWRGKTVQGQYTLELEPLGLEEGDTLYYFIRAADNRDLDPQADDRNQGDSREYEVRIVSPRTKREEIRLREEEARREIQLLIDKQETTKDAVEDIIGTPESGGTP